MILEVLIGRKFAEVLAFCPANLQLLSEVVLLYGSKRLNRRVKF